MLTVVQQVLNGLTTGSFYAFVALGYSLVYAILELINFAHGDLFGLGSYVGYTVFVYAFGVIGRSLGLWGLLAVGFIAGALATAGAGFIIERVACRHIYPIGRLPAVVSALGMAIFLSNFIMAVWGQDIWPAKRVSSPRGFGKSGNSKSACSKS